MLSKLIVVITGVTCGVLHQDDFYHTNLDQLESIPELNYHVYDKINAYDMDKMMISINSQISEVLVLEGILLLDDIRIPKLANLIFFIVLDKSVCLNRREARTFLPPEPLGYFENYAWPEYEKHLTKIKNKNQDIIFLNGSDSIDFNTTIVVNHIKQLLLDVT